MWRQNNYVIRFRFAKALNNKSSTSSLPLPNKTWSTFRFLCLAKPLYALLWIRIAIHSILIWIFIGVKIIWATSNLEFITSRWIRFHCFNVLTNLNYLCRNYFPSLIALIGNVTAFFCCLKASASTITSIAFPIFYF
jgi:hypothetical protein